MKKATKKSATLVAVVVLAMGMAGTASAATALVPQGTTMRIMAGPGNQTLIIAGLKIKHLDVYHHDGRNNTIYSATEMGGSIAAGPYSVVLEAAKKQTAPYGFSGDAFNFQHLVTEVDDASAVCEVPRWAHIDGAECFKGCPSYMGFNPRSKNGVISVPVFWRGKNEAEFVIFQNLTPAAQEAFMTMFNGGAIMPPIHVR